jgi:copper chaperone CopZ
MRETFHLANIKCGGCAHSIKTKLEDINGISDVIAIPEDGTVTFNFENEETKITGLENLKKMGYPLSTEDNTILTKAKSYASCMIGKVNK